MLDDTKKFHIFTVKIDKLEIMQQIYALFSNFICSFVNQNRYGICQI